MFEGLKVPHFKRVVAHPTPTNGGLSICVFRLPKESLICSCPCQRD